MENRFVAFWGLLEPLRTGSLVFGPVQYWSEGEREPKRVLEREREREAELERGAESGP